MRRTRFSTWPCSVARTVDLLGDWWTPLVLREAFYGVHRFEDMQRNLSVSRNVLAQRLKRLVEEEVLKRVPYQDNPPRDEYRLTRKGRDLFGVVLAMMRWGDDHLSSAEGPPIEVVWRESGEVIRPLVIDEVTGQPIDPRQVLPRLGPGFPDALREHPEVLRRFSEADPKSAP